MRIFFQNPTKGPLITVSFDAGDGASLAFVPAVMDCGVKYGVAAAGAPVIATAAVIGALVPGDSPVRMPTPVVPNPLEGINRFAPRASVGAIEDGRTIERTMQSADAVGLPDESTPTTAADVSPLAGLAAKLKDWDGIAPLEIAGFKFEKVADTDGKPTIKITITTDNVQDIIDTAQAIQVALPEDTHTLTVEVNAPNLRRNILKWAHQYFEGILTKIKENRSRILEISDALERGEPLSLENQKCLQDLEATLQEFIDLRDDYNQNGSLVRFLIYKTTKDSGIRKSWEGIMHDSERRTHSLFGFSLITRRLLRGRPLTEEYVELLDSVSNSSLEYIIKNAISLAKNDIKRADITKVTIDKNAFEFALANDEYLDTLIDILANLISNAARYSDFQKETREIHISIKHVDGGLEIEVRDNGIGIPAEKLNDIGQFGFRVGEKSVEGSRGHGLWQVHKNLEDLGWGNLRVDSVHDEGSAFRFVIPEQDVR